MNVKITYTNGSTSIVPVSDSATVKFTWHTVSADGYQRSDNEQAFALKDIEAFDLVEDAPAVATDVHAAADPVSEVAPVAPVPVEDEPAPLAAVPDAPAADVTTDPPVADSPTTSENASSEASSTDSTSSATTTDTTDAPAAA